MKASWSIHCPRWPESAWRDLAAGFLTATAGILVSGSRWLLATPWIVDAYPAVPPDTRAAHWDGAGPVEPLHVVALIYELLDAHYDTARLARDLETDARWLAHLDYLRHLQRIGRTALAQTFEAMPA